MMQLQLAASSNNNEENQEALMEWVRLIDYCYCAWLCDLDFVFSQRMQIKAKTFATFAFPPALSYSSELCY